MFHFRSFGLGSAGEGAAGGGQAARDAAVDQLAADADDEAAQQVGVELHLREIGLP